jgi:heme oxygenase
MPNRSLPSTRPPFELTNPMTFYQDLQTATEAERRELHAAPVIAAAMAGRVERRHYLDFLGRAFHHVKHTVPLLMACGARLPDELDWLRKDVAHYIEEEIGHHEWILNDIAAAGGQAEAVRHSLPDIDTDVLVAYAYDIVMRRNPVGLFGMVYVLEGSSVALASTAALSLRRALDLPAEAFSYLSSHGVLDIEHIGDFELLVNRLDRPADRQAVVSAAKTVYRLYGNVLRGIDLGAAA